MSARRALVDYLDANSCRAILDVRELQVGEAWRPELIAEELTSDACVALISSHALSSHHVHEELMIARLRHEGTSGEYAVLPVLLAPVTRQDLNDSPLAHLKLPDLHMSTWDYDEERGQLPADLRQAIATVSRSRSTTEPQVYEVVASHLKGAHTSALEHAAQILEMPPSPWAQYLPNTVALELLKERLVEVPSDPLRRALKRVLPTVPTPGGRRIVERVVPFSRIPRNIAVQLREIAADPGRRVAALCVHDELTPLLFVRRASEGANSWKDVQPSVDIRLGYTEGLIWEIRAQLRDKVLFGWPGTDAEVEQELRNREIEEGPVTVILRDEVDDVLLDRLVTEFPLLLFLVVGVHVGTDGLRVVHGLGATQERALVRLYRELMTDYT
jgi:hypothetical protein